MAEPGFGERQSLGKCTNSSRRYGSTETKRISNDTFIKHVLHSGETLQGIALKYGTTMEQIKRTNNMWTSDSLFLREYLLIPQDAAVSPGTSQTNPLSNGNNEHEIVTSYDIRMARSSSREQQLGSSSENSVPKVQKEVTALDFLSKFDNNLAKLKTNVQKCDASSNFPEDSSNPLNYLPSRKSSTRRSSRESQRSHDIEDVTREPNMVFKSSSNNRRVQSSLEKLEKVQDDMFEL